MNPVLLGLALTFGAPALKEKPAPEPTLIGEWIPESVSVNGNPAESGTDRWMFAADGTRAVYTRGTAVDSGTFTFDPKGSPSTVDLSSPAAGRPPNLCRYQLDGDTLVLSVGHDPGVRPADTQPGPNVTVWVFKRAKMKD